jgi:hypothetical protein
VTSYIGTIDSCQYFSGLEINLLFVNNMLQSPAYERIGFKPKTFIRHVSLAARVPMDYQLRVIGGGL